MEHRRLSREVDKLLSRNRALLSGAASSEEVRLLTSEDRLTYYLL
jgi:hypothetical protein